jgi:hypothetical protein
MTGMQKSSLQQGYSAALVIPRGIGAMKVMVMNRILVSVIALRYE